MSNNSSLDLYSILGLDHNASAEDIKSAYRRAARRLHPDVNHHRGAMLQFQEIVEAYEILSDDKKHRRYRRERASLGKLPKFSTVVTRSKRNLAVISEPQVLYVLLDIHAKRLQDDDRPMRAPLNLSLVLDHSKSMEGERLDRVKVAAHQVVSQMSDADRISVVAFSDRANVIVPSTLVEDPVSIRTRISMMVADGATAIFQGLQAAYRQIEAYYSPEAVNHIILITDGETYGDEGDCLELATEAATKGIGISAMGIGEEWNDVFLDEIAGRTGGASAYINSPSSVVQFLNERVRNLGDAFAERVSLTIAPETDVDLETIFRLSPSAQPLDVDTQPVPLGTLAPKRPISVLLQFQMPAEMPEDTRSIARLVVTGDVLTQGQRVQAQTIEEATVSVMQNPPVEMPPPNVVDALSRMTLYKMHERTEEALLAGNIEEATRRLENLSTRLLEIGQADLAQEAANEARRVRSTHALSETGRKNLKFGTRALMPLVIQDVQE